MDSNKISNSNVFPPYMEAPFVARNPIINTQTVLPHELKTFYLNNPNGIIGWYQFNWYTDKPDQVKIPITLISKSFIRDTDAHGYGIELTFFNLSADKQVELTVQGYYMISGGLVQIDSPNHSIQKESYNMVNKLTFTDYADTLTLVPGDAKSIIINSPNSDPIVDVFHFDPTGKNLKTSLTGKLRITSAEWRLSFFNADTVQPVILSFVVLTGY